MGVGPVFAEGTPSCREALLGLGKREIRGDPVLERKLAPSPQVVESGIL